MPRSWSEGAEVCRHRQGIRVSSFRNHDLLRQALISLALNTYELLYRLRPVQDPLRSLSAAAYFVSHKASHPMTTRRLSSLSLVLTAFVALGCGGPDGPTKFALHGTVTREGKPLREGIIEMIPVAGGPAAVANIAEGEYAFTTQTGPVEGDQEVKILRVLERGPIPAGGVPKDADFLPETGFKTPMPEDGWLLQTTVSPDQDVSEPVDFNVDNAKAAAGRRGAGQKP